MLDLNLPTVAVLNQIDAARSHGIDLDPERVSEQLACPVVEASARTGEGIDRLLLTIAESLTLPDACGAQRQRFAPREAASRGGWGGNG